MHYLQVWLRNTELNFCAILQQNQVHLLAEPNMASKCTVEPLYIGTSIFDYIPTVYTITHINRDTSG